MARSKTPTNKSETEADDIRESAALASSYEHDVEVNLKLFGQLMEMFIRRMYEQQIKTNNINVEQLLKPKKIATITRTILAQTQPELSPEDIIPDTPPGIWPAILQSMNTILLKLVLDSNQNLSKLSEIIDVNDHSQLNALTTVWSDVIQVLAAKIHDDLAMLNRDNAIVVTRINNFILDQDQKPDAKFYLDLINALEIQILNNFAHKLPITGDPKEKLRETINGITSDELRKVIFDHTKNLDAKDVNETKENKDTKEIKLAQLTKAFAECIADFPSDKRKKRRPTI